MNITTLTAKAEELGYTLHINEGKIQHIWPTDRNSFTPELYMPRERFGETTEWEIQTTGYSSMDSAAVESVIDGLKRAQQMISHLEHSGIEVR